MNREEALAPHVSSTDTQVTLLGSDITGDLLWTVDCDEGVVQY
jgi:hypothetical protein